MFAIPLVKFLMKDSYALVSGASSGIGFQFARVLAEYGYNLIIVSNEAEALEQKASEIREAFPVKVETCCMDLGKTESAKSLYDYCQQKGFEVEFLVNNAGVYHDRDFLDDSEGFNSLILMLHVYTPAMLVYHFAKDMVKRHKGYIINISSVTSDFGIQRMATYSSTKGFLKLFSRSTHIELKDKGVNVTCVRPGAIATTLYNIKPALMKLGLAFGFIMTPERLARKSVKAALRGRAQITPGLTAKFLHVLVALIPTCVLRLIRCLKIF